MSYRVNSFSQLTVSVSLAALIPVVFCQCAAIKQASPLVYPDPAQLPMIDGAPPTWVDSEPGDNSSGLPLSTTPRMGIRQIEIVRVGSANERASFKPQFSEMSPEQLERYLEKVEAERSQVDDLGWITGAAGRVIGMSHYGNNPVDTDLVRPLLSVRLKPTLSADRQSVQLRVFALVSDPKSGEIHTRIDRQATIAIGNSIVIGGVPRGVGEFETRSGLVRSKRQRLTRQTVLVITATKDDDPSLPPRNL